MLTRKLPGNPVLLPKVTYTITITQETIATIKHKILEKNAKIKPKIVVPMHYKIGGLSLPIAGLDSFLEQAKNKVIHVGNEIDIEKEDLPKEPEIWTFTL